MRSRCVVAADMLRALRAATLNPPSARQRERG
jgi:hypothetical protein